jgi:hypothetical protein
MGSDHETDRPDERQSPSESWAVEVLRADLSNRPRSKPPEPEEQERKIPQTRIGRSAKLGTAIGGQATRYAGTAAANVVRSEERSQERLETRHI